MSALFDKGGGKRDPDPTPEPSEFRDKERAGRGAWVGSLVGNFANAVVTIGAAYGGFKAMGPAGLAGGVYAGQAAGDSLKHFATSYVDAKISKTSAKPSEAESVTHTPTTSVVASGGGAASSFSNIGELRQAVSSEIKRASDEGDNSVAGAKSRLEATLQTIVRATEDSGHEAVEQMKAAVELAISLCDSGVLRASQSAQQKAGVWAGGL